MPAYDPNASRDYRKHYMRDYRLKEGRKQKDAELVEGFNQQKIESPLGRQEKAQLNKQVKDQKQAPRKTRQDLDDIDLVGECGETLADLRYAYKYSSGPSGKRGKLRLEELMEDDSIFKFAIRELIKMETAVLVARSKKVEGGGVANQNFFVVLKGLEDGPRQISGTVGTGDKVVDIAQIGRALNPEDNNSEPEQEGSKHDAPEMLLRQPENQTEGW